MFCVCREEESALSRWLRELRAGVGGGSENDTKPEAKVTAKSATLDRSNPIYHSEGKGLRARRAAKDRRRHSFNQRPQPLLSNRSVKILVFSIIFIELENMASFLLLGPKIIL